ncbi:cytochrome P450 [Pseudonocardia endophytica]|uniref:Cytochrome P450 n=1 Tax=Pseudonocardia endophytica TaxID=401976 RepID=A0A4R1HUS8_PSEEN|nr:cytochrome P450 [Pseudonocardia endophytica]TCK25123.1 cytochrome P450 [Pseudonocardia endophytica]
MGEASMMLPLLRDRLAPSAELTELRGRLPVASIAVPDEIGARGWLVTGYAQVREVLGDTVRFSNELSHLAGTGIEQLAEQDPGGLGFRDPPEHTRLRRLLTREFTVRRLARLGPRIDALTTELLDAMQAEGPGVDLVERFAVPLPSQVICELLGVPDADRSEFERRSTARFDMIAQFDNSLDVVNESMDYLRGLAARERANPGEGLLGALVREHGDNVSDEDLAQLADGVLTGGHETTASMIALSAYELMSDEPLRSRLATDAHGVVEDLLRRMSVVQVAFPRFARDDTVVGGREIAKGDAMICSLSAANTDPAAHGAGHLAFGYGIHRCVGAELGRMELRAALPALFARFPALAPAVDEDDLELRSFSIVFGMDNLPVRW